MPSEIMEYGESLINVGSIVAQYGGSSGTSLMYYLYNGHGDVVQTVTASGEVQNNYDIFGNPVLTIETVSCTIRYAGEYLDKETGLYYLRARYYDPTIRRFISEDSYWGEHSNPLSLNLYTYAYNNPIRYIDPTGHMTEEEMFAEATRNAQIKWLINEIEKQKQIWFEEEKGAGKNQKEWTAAQVEANRKAEELRQQLLKLEAGNDKLQQLIRDDSKAIAGAWEGYKLAVTGRIAEANPHIDYSETIRKLTEDFALAVTYGRNAIGISASDVSETTRTAVEKFAESVVISYRTEREYNLMRMSDISYAFGERIVTIKDEIIPLAYAIDSGVAPGRRNEAEELLYELLGLIDRYSGSKKHWLGFLGIKSQEQKDIHEEANRIRKKIWEYKRRDTNYNRLFTW